MAECYMYLTKGSNTDILNQLATELKVAEFPKFASNTVVYFSNLCYVYINKSRCKVSIN